MPSQERMSLHTSSTPYKVERICTLPAAHHDQRLSCVPMIKNRTYKAGLEIATDTVANATNISSLATNNSAQFFAT